ncbi:MAG TPA: hypothetical protein DCG72_06295 [Gammaproteobacteria bacterium]|nr:hypothetical protein [Gammaproteobacteria bacterium]
MSEETTKLRSRSETADALCISLPTLDKLVKAGSIPHIPIGHRISFDLKEVIAALKSGSATPTQNPDLTP